MAGLLEKDIRLILGRKSSIVLFFVCGGIVTWQFMASGSSAAYMTMLGALLSLGTLTYDDNDHCMQFLLTLPCSVKEYALEKYLFVGGASLVSWFAGCLMSVIANLVKGLPLTGDLMLEMVVSAIPIMFGTMALMIPIQIRFGAEHSRIILLLVFGIIVALVSGFYMVGGSTANDATAALDAMNPLLVAGAMVAFLLVVTIISYFATVRILEKKEF